MSSHPSESFRGAFVFKNHPSDDEWLISQRNPEFDLEALREGGAEPQTRRVLRQRFAGVRTVEVDRLHLLRLSELDGRLFALDRLQAEPATSRVPLENVTDEQVRGAVERADDPPPALRDTDRVRVAVRVGRGLDQVDANLCLADILLFAQTPVDSTCERQAETCVPIRFEARDDGHETYARGASDVERSEAFDRLGPRCVRDRFPDAGLDLLSERALEDGVEAWPEDLPGRVQNERHHHVPEEIFRRGPPEALHEDDADQPDAFDGPVGHRLLAIGDQGQLSARLADVDLEIADGDRADEAPTHESDERPQERAAHVYRLVGRQVDDCANRRVERRHKAQASERGVESDLETREPQEEADHEREHGLDLLELEREPLPLPPPDPDAEDDDHRGDDVRQVVKPVTGDHGGSDVRADRDLERRLDRVVCDRHGLSRVGGLVPGKMMRLARVAHAALAFSGSATMRIGRCVLAATRSALLP